MQKKNPVVHFEIPYADRDRMVAFYEKAFGWESQKLGPEMGNYVVMTTAEMDPETKFPKTPGQINGGFYQKTDDPISQYPSVVVAVDDIRESIQKVKAAGGTVRTQSGTEEPDDIPGVGLFVSVIDTEGNRISMLQPYPMMETRPQ
ncbi:MAG: VOC family protein [Patescibacteria group bacterium]|nr:VOC family protein [Patescibacteria group bacterium]